MHAAQLLRHPHIQCFQRNHFRNIHMRGNRLEVSADQVHVNAIAPGWINAPMYRAATDNDPPRRAKILGRIQMNRVGDPDDIGWAAVFLFSEAAKYITGVRLPVDGGALVGF